MKKDRIVEPYTFGDFGVVYIDNFDRLRHDGFGALPSPERKHWAGFTPEQQKKIRESRPPNLLSQAIRDYQPNLWNRLLTAFSEALRAFLLVWRGTK